ncbi:hypothetical protein VTO42DRAFT_7682 [Malbranchea cinnamomea]
MMCYPTDEDKPQAKPEESDKTLKYHLLGPSLTKAGQDQVDQRKVSEIIYNASKGSKFFNHEKARDKVLTEKIEQIRAQKAKLERIDTSAYVRRADDYIAELESQRDLSQTIVHIDCDAFFAAVEELDRPELRNVPMAVGKGVLTTCNYHARKFGCRSGMAAFVAKKLCPDLVLLPPNYEKYSAKAKEIRAILEKYDPLFEPASIDEAYVNITQYCSANNVDPQEAVRQLRQEVHSQTKVTVSAGIAANARIAKICSNWNKPNGQYFVPNDRSSIMSFMASIPVRKVNGIGRVFERELEAVGIKTCGDIYQYRGILSQLFGQKAFQFLMRCYLGLGRTRIEPPDESQRKSVGTESTFQELEGLPKLQGKLREIAAELERDMLRTQFKGRTLVLKVKLHTFEVFTRQTVLPKAVCTAEDLYKYSLPLLVKLNKEIPNMKLRLMGLRCTNLVSTKKVGLEFFGFHNREAKQTADQAGPVDKQIFSADEEFEVAALHERLEEMDQLERLSQEITESNDGVDANERKGDPAECPTWSCPICSSLQPAEDTSFNQHVDFCLSRETIKEVVKGTLQTSSQPLSKRKASAAFVGPTANSRKRPFFG